MMLKMGGRIFMKTHELIIYPKKGVHFIWYKENDLFKLMQGKW